MKRLDIVLHAISGLALIAEQHPSTGDEDLNAHLTGLAVEVLEPALDLLKKEVQRVKNFHGKR